MSGELPSGSSVALCGLPDDGGSAPQQFASIVSTVRIMRHETRTFLLIDNTGKGVACHRDRTAPDVSHAGISGVSQLHRRTIPEVDSVTA